MKRYERQTGLIDQKKLAGSKIVIAGLGGLGSPAALYLAAAGIGELVLIDHDKLEESNLNRQILYSENQIGEKKVKLAKQRLLDLNSSIKITILDKIPAKIDADVFLDCLDNWTARKKFWKLALESGVLVHGAVEHDKGELAVIIDKKSAELILKKQKSGCQRILGPAVGTIGSMMALKTLEILKKKPASSYFLSFDGNEISRYPINTSLTVPDWDMIIVRYSEIWTKSDMTKRKMELKLIDNLRKAVPDAKITRLHGRILIEPYSENLLKSAAQVFGVKSVSPVIKLGHAEFESELTRLIPILVPVNTSFRITANRAWKQYATSSTELNKRFGQLVLELVEGVRVDLTSAQLNLEIEVNKNSVFVFTDRRDGPGGLPLGVGGKLLLLFSGGLDSPVAAYLLAKRGVESDLLFLNPLSDVLESKVSNVYHSMKSWLPEAQMFVIDTASAVDQIKQKVNEGERQTVLKRLLYRIAERVALEQGYDAIATGESLGQASSQTLQSLAVIQQAISTTVIRPLIGFNKNETIRLAKQIGTYDVSSAIEEFCSLESHSNASPEIAETLRQETKLEFDIEQLSGSIRKAKNAPVPDLKPESMTGLELVRLWEGMP
ncbi:MAG: tRNA 4-thiouridine(8) synthase ThiI, partial [Candidatus Altiarchaeota archaeon]|nr:tRNA 4-thiouridine(8) synthase ThiI [Candidatus Altiarchaeota archaeon]